MTLAVGPIEVPSEVGLPPLNMVPDFTAGLIFGFTGDNHLDELRTCMTDADVLVKDAEKALADIKAGHVIQGVEDMGDIIWALPDAVSGCSDLDDDMDAILAWADIFKHPTQLAKTVAKNWLFHGAEAKADLAQQEADWAAQDYFAAGEDAADVLVDILGPIPTEDVIPLFGISA